MIIRCRPRSRRAAPPRRHARTAPRARRRLTVLAAAVPIGLVASSTLVWQSSYAAFVDTTSTPGNAWKSGVVELENDRGTALFTTGAEGLLVPGNSGYRCITVAYDGNVDTNDTGVRLYGALTAGSSAELAAALRITVEISTTALATPPGAACLPAFETSPVTYAATSLVAFPTGYGTGIGDVDGDGRGDWRPLATGDRSRTYRISYSLPPGSPDSLQGKQVGMTFTWEVRAGV